MSTHIPAQSRHIRSLLTPSGELELSIVDLPVPAPGPDEVLIRTGAAPINPSDIGTLFGAADLATARQSGTADRPVVTLQVPDAALRAMAGRVGRPMPAGLEGAGVVVAAGSSASAQALLGRTVAAFGLGMYGEHRCLSVDACLPLPEGTTAAEGASCFVNPLTALGMVETMRREGHTALVHTAAASNLGQMLVKICQQDGVPLVNIVRRAEQADLLRSLGAEHVCVSSAPRFMQDLTEAVASTGATLAFDATGGGRLAGEILTCMEAALTRAATTYDRYGSTRLKQVYVYGRLDSTPLELSGAFGMTWAVGGWLLFPFLEKAGPDTVQRLRSRVVAGLKSVFVSHYARRVTLSGALSLEAIAAYTRRATGEKFLIEM